MHAELTAKLKTARVRYIQAVVDYRRERDAAEAKLRAAEHEFSQAMAELFCGQAGQAVPASTVVSGAGN